MNISPRALLSPALLPLSLSALLLSACAVTPDPITPEERMARVDAVRSILFAEQEPITAPVTLYEAIARGLKYNLDQRLALMEEAVQARQLDLTNLDMLPRVAAEAGYTVRSNTLASSSFSILSGRQSLEPSTSSEKEQYTANLSFSWNLLDFGLSYFQAKQQADRVLVSAERRRRVIGNVVQEIRAAYWQAATGERLLASINPVIAEAEAALVQSREIEAARIMPPLEVLEYQKSLLEVVRQLKVLRTDVATAKARLASLMNVPPGQPYSLALPPVEEIEPPTLPVDLETLERIALFSRPELREEDYQQRISEEEVRKAKLRLLPGIGVVANASYDDNDYLVHNFWADAGVRMSYNIIGLLTAPTARKLAEAQVEVAATRQLALSVAIITQINIAHTQYRQALEQYRQATELNEIEKRIFEQVSNAAAIDAGGALERIRRSVQSISAELQRDRSLAEVQTAYSNIFAALGVDPLPEMIEDRDVATIARALEAIGRDWRNGKLPPLPVIPDSRPQSESTPSIKVTVGQRCEIYAGQGKRLGCSK